MDKTTKKRLIKRFMGENAVEIVGGIGLEPTTSCVLESTCACPLYSLVTGRVFTSIVSYIWW
jgi:hypothetical protein